MHFKTTTIFSVSALPKTTNADKSLLCAVIGIYNLNKIKLVMLQNRKLPIEPNVAVGVNNANENGWLNDPFVYHH